MTIPEVFLPIRLEQFHTFKSHAENCEDPPNRMSMYWCGYCHWFGTGGQEQNREEAFEAWEQAADMGNLGEDGLGIVFARLIDCYPEESLERELVTLSR
jgi:hypothetical protein